MKKMFEIIVKSLLPQEELNYNDQDCWPDEETVIEVEAEDEEKALEYFHDHYPIKVLDDFDISIEKANADE